MTLKVASGNSLAVQWLGLRVFTAKDASSTPGWGNKILQALWRSQRKKKTKQKVASRLRTMEIGIFCLREWPKLPFHM